MRALKILVGVMAVMIVAGVALLIVAIADRVSRRAPSSAPFTAAPIALPAGARVETLSVGGNRLVVDIVLPDGNRQLLVIDLATGARLGAIPLQSGP